MPAPSLKTKRLLLRQWKDSDLSLFAKMNADSRVMECFPSTLSKEESDSLAERIQKELNEKEYGLWAIEVVGIAPFIGFVGLHYQDFPAAFTPCIEIGWRLAHEHWGKGYAREAAEKVIDYAFNTLKLKEIVSFTTPDNQRSWSLMEKLGMTHNPEDDFYHTKIPRDHALAFHVLYRKQHSKEKIDSIQIVFATKQDAENLNTLAFAAKASWGYPKHHLESWEEEINVKPELIQNNRIFKAVNANNELLGFYGLEGSPPKLILEGFWVNPQKMGKGIGKCLFKHMLGTARSFQAEFVEWESDPNAYDFYIHMGAKKVGQRTYELHGKQRTLPILTIKIEKKLPQ